MFYLQTQSHHRSFNTRTELGVGHGSTHQYSPSVPKVVTSHQLRPFPSSTVVEMSGTTSKCSAFLMGREESCISSPIMRYSMCAFYMATLCTSYSLNKLVLCKAAHPALDCTVIYCGVFPGIELLGSHGAFTLHIHSGSCLFKVSNVLNLTFLKGSPVWLSWNSLHGPRWPQIWRFACL